MTSKSIAHYVNKLVTAARRQEKSGEEVKRYALFPVLDEPSYAFYQQQEIIQWTASELAFVDDKKHYDEASPEVRRVIDIILAFFLSGDGAISNNIALRFLLECRTFEEQAMFISQLHIELVHAEAYGLATFTFKRDPKTMGELIEAAQQTPCVQRKIDFMEKWMLSDTPRYQRLVAFACSEGIFFCNLFAVIFWFRARGLFPNFIHANEMIARDESLHRDFGAHLFQVELKEMLKDLPEGSSAHQLLYQKIKDEVLAIVQKAVSIEDMFTEHILETPMDDLTADSLKVYTRLIADNLLHQLSFSSHYQVKNPFTWLNDISMEQKGNFYEVRIGSYKKRSLAEVLDWKGRAGLNGDGEAVYANPEELDF